MLGSATVGIFLKFDPATSASFQTVSLIGAGTELTTQSGFANVAAATWYFFECWRTAATGALNFALNRSMLTAHTVRLPTTEPMAPHVHLITNEAVLKTFDLDAAIVRAPSMIKRWA